MAKKPISYDNLAVLPQRKEPETDLAGTERPAGQGTLKEVSWHTLVYHSEYSAKAIAQLALEQSSVKHKVRSHDIWIEAMQAYLDKHGIMVDVRAKPKRRKS
jgi:hypothetical protein